MKTGDMVVLLSEGSWVHGMLGQISALDTESSDGIKGHCVTVPGHGYTVVSPSELLVIRNSEQYEQRSNR